MEIFVLSTIAFLTLLADGWAIMGVLAATSDGGRRAGWIALIVGVPVVGALGWLMAGQPAEGVPA